LKKFNDEQAAAYDAPRATSASGNRLALDRLRFGVCYNPYTSGAMGREQMTLSRRKPQVATLGAILPGFVLRLKDIFATEEP
jgi:hypothetical protein